MNLLVIKTSNRASSISNQLADYLLEACQTRYTDKLHVETLYADELPHVDAIYSETLRLRDQARGHSNSLHISDTLIAQLERADNIIIATPIHNFTVPSALKSWIDHVVRIGKTFTATPEGKVGMLADRPVYIAVSSGGMLGGKQPDFLTSYLQTILATIGMTSVHFFVIEGTVLGEKHIELQWTQVKQEIDNLFARQVPE